SCAVPKCNVVNSRTVLPLPISSRVGSPRYFLSCEMAPTEQNGKKWLSLPMVVRPSITQCASMRVLAPMRTCGPITVKGPTLTLLSSSAAGSITAVGCINATVSILELAHGAHQTGFGGYVVADERFAAILAHAAGDA